jgi:hypothetical protein
LRMASLFSSGSVSLSSLAALIASCSFFVRALGAAAGGGLGGIIFDSMDRCLELRATGYHWPHCPECHPLDPEDKPLPPPEPRPGQQVIEFKAWSGAEDDEDDEDTLIEKLRDCPCCQGFYKMCRGKECEVLDTCKCLFLLKKGLPITLTLY